MSKVLVYTISRADTTQRAKLLTSTITQGVEMAGMDLEWVLYANSPLAGDIGVSLKRLGLLKEVHEFGSNVGQHIPANLAHQRAIDQGYDYVIRTDDDVEWITKRWAAKLVEASQKLGDKMVLSPLVRGLRNPVPQTQQVEVEGIPLRFVEQAIGGICRLIPVKALREHPYVSDVRLPLGGGDAVNVAKWCVKNLIYAAYCQHIHIRHAKTTSGQEADDPMYFKFHDVAQYIPYIPLTSGL